MNDDTAAWFTPAGDGRVDLHLEDRERELIAGVMGQARIMILEGDQRAWRLFPETYPDDAEMEARHREMVGDDLRDNRLAAIETVTSTLNETSIDGEALDEWVRALNAVRLVLGTALDITDETDHRDLPEDGAQRMQFAVYDYLSHMLDEAIGALAELGGH